MEPSRTNAQNATPSKAAPSRGGAIDAAHDAGQQDGFDPEEYIESFSALKTSMSQGRDLKKKRKALEEYVKTLETLKDAYADRVHIEQNYDEVVREQEIIINSTNGELERAMKRRDEVERKISAANDSLAELKHELAHGRKPLEEELDRRNAELASAKDELKQVKAQRESLELFDADPAEAQASEAAHDAVVDKVNAKLDDAKAAQRAAQKALDAREKDERARVKRAQDTIKGLTGDRDKANKKIEDLEKKLAASHDRIAFCGHVIEHPEETRAMRERIAENERTAAEMDAQISRLAAVYAKSKAASGKAKAVVIGVIVVLALFIAFFFFVSNR